MWNMLCFSCAPHWVRMRKLRNYWVIQSGITAGKSRKKIENGEKSCRREENLIKAKVCEVRSEVVVMPAHERLRHHKGKNSVPGPGRKQFFK